jgi:hypothetical protein
LSPEFDDILKVVYSFHDGSLGCASFDYHGPMAFIDMMWFGPELGYNPKPIIGGVFWFDLNHLTQVNELGFHSGRGIGSISLSKATCSIEIQFLDEPYEKLEFNFGPEANFQFIASSSLDDATLERR